MREEGYLPHTLRHITWRGAIRSCNYNCGYCPLAKRPPNQAEIQRDNKSLERFIHFLCCFQPLQPLSVLFAPYGEALIHPHTQNALAHLSRLEQIGMLSCQTNLSLPAAELLNRLSDENAVTRKIALWASFHPTMTSVETFTEQAHVLSASLRLTVIVVGDPYKLPVIQRLAALLPPAIPLRINAMDGLNRRYNAEEISAFTALDPLFALELKHYNADFRFCSGGRQSIFAQADGSMYPCNRSRIRIGNLYDDPSIIAAQAVPSEGKCQGRCDCFLAYSNRRDVPELHKLQPYPQLRL